MQAHTLSTQLLACVTTPEVNKQSNGAHVCMSLCKPKLNVNACVVNLPCPTLIRILLYRICCSKPKCGVHRRPLSSPGGERQIIPQRCGAASGIGSSSSASASASSSVKSARLSTGFEWALQPTQFHPSEPYQHPLRTRL